MNTLAQVVNWHRYAYAILFALDTVCVAIVSGTVEVPDSIKGMAAFAGIASIFLAAFLPRAQLEAGPGAPPILSPPAK